MKLNFISHVSLMVMAIAVNQSVYAMDDFLDEKKSQNKPVLIKQEACSEDWRQTYLKKKYLFSEPSLDVFRILVGIKNKSLSAEQAEVLLIEASQRGETDAQTKLYGFYTAPYLDQINLVDPDKAVNLLLLGVMQGQTWALMEASKRANSFDDKKKMHRQLADRGDQKSIEFLRNQLTKQQASLLGDPYTLAGIIYLPEASFPQKVKAINTFLDMCKKADYHEAIPPVLQLLRDNLQNKTLRGLYIEFAKQGAVMGNVWCMLELHSKGEDKDGTWLSKAAGLGDTKALELVDKFFFYEKSDLKTALKYAKQNAERGDIDSMDLCGEIYFLWEKFEKSLPYYLEVEKRGRAFAAYRIGDMYDQMGDEIKSMGFLIKAVEKGIGGAAFQIGLIYKRMKNYRLSLMWLLKAVEFDLDPRNTMLVQIAIGEVYQKLGNYQKVLEHTEKVKSAGGYLNAGLLHNKLGNDQECERLWLKAARLNNLMAIENLAFFYFYKDNYASSLYWGKIAKSMGSQKAEEFLGKAEKEQKKQK